MLIIQHELLEVTGFSANGGIESVNGDSNFCPTHVSLSKQGIVFSTLRQPVSSTTTEGCLHNLSDGQLVEQLLTGDMSAFGRLYERYKAPLYAYCYRLIGDEQSAQDAAQETFLKIRAGISTLEKREAFRAWMYRIAHNEVMQSLRRSRRNGQALSEDDVWDHQTPLELYQQLETRELVQKYLATLKTEYREVLVLREFDQLSYAEIADVTGATESSVKSRIFKARKALLKKLTPYFGN